MLKPVSIILLTVVVVCALGAQRIQITQPAGNVTVGGGGGGGGGDAYLANSQTFTGPTNTFTGVLIVSTQEVDYLSIDTLDLGPSNVLTILQNLTNGTAGQVITATGPGTYALSNLVSGSGGDIYAANNNTFTATNVFTRMVTLGSLSRSNFLPSATEFYFFTEFLTGTSGTTTTAFLPFQGNAINSGTASAAQGLTNHPGIITLASASGTANSGYAYTCNATALIPRPGDFFRSSWRPFNTNAGVRQYLGFHDQGGAASAPTDGLCVFQSNNIVYGQAWNNSTLVQTLNSISVDSNAWYSAWGFVLNDTVAQFIVTDETGSVLLSDTITNGVPFTRGYGAGIVAFYTNSPGGSVNLGQYDNVHVGNVRNIMR